VKAKGKKEEKFHGKKGATLGVGKSNAGCLSARGRKERNSGVGGRKRSSAEGEKNTRSFRTEKKGVGKKGYRASQGEKGKKIPSTSQREEKKKIERGRTASRVITSASESGPSTWEKDRRLGGREKKNHG